MQWLSVFKEIGIFTLGTVTITSVLGFVAKSIFDSWLSSRIEAHKAELNMNVELHKAKLLKETSEHQIKYSRLHNDRAETIKELYAKLYKMEKNMKSLFNPVQLSGELPKQEKLEPASDSFNELMDFFNENRIFFDVDVCEIMDTIRDEILNAWHDFTGYDLHQDKLSEIKEVRKEQREVWRACWNTVKQEIPQLKENLENEFRTLLGVST